MRQKSIIMAISQSIIDDKVIVIEGLDNIKSNTKSVHALLNQLKLEDIKTLCLLDQSIKPFIQGSKNIKSLTVSQAKRTNVFELMNANKIIIHKPALELLAQTFSHATPQKDVKVKSL
jgi:ribosomal protein L4